MKSIDAKSPFCPIHENPLAPVYLDPGSGNIRPTELLVVFERCPQRLVMTGLTGEELMASVRFVARPFRFSTAPAAEPSWFVGICAQSGRLLGSRASGTVPLARVDALRFVSPPPSPMKFAVVPSKKSGVYPLNKFAI